MRKLELGKLIEIYARLSGLYLTEETFKEATRELPDEIAAKIDYISTKLQNEISAWEQYPNDIHVLSEIVRKITIAYQQEAFRNKEADMIARIFEECLSPDEWADSTTKTELIVDEPADKSEPQSRCVKCGGLGYWHEGIPSEVIQCDKCALPWPDAVRIWGIWVDLETETAHSNEWRKVGSAPDRHGYRMICTRRDKGHTVYKNHPSHKGYWSYWIAIDEEGFLPTIECPECGHEQSSATNFGETECVSCRLLYKYSINRIGDLTTYPIDFPFGDTR